MRLIQGIRVTLRNLRRAPAFALTAILILSSGIGISTAVFTIANTILLRKLPVQAQEELVVLWGRSPDGRFEHYPLTLPQARDLTRDTKTLSRVGYFGYEGAWPTPFRDRDRVLPLSLATVSGNFLDLLGVEPAAGRRLVPEDNVTGAAPVAVLSHRAWQRFFGGDDDAVGRDIQMHATDLTYRVVGVMPRGVDFPRGTDVWVPLVPTRTAPGSDTAYAYVDLIARMQPGLPLAAAREEVTSSFELLRTSPADPAFQGVASSYFALTVGDVKPAIIAFSAAAALLLLITCINVASLLVVRGLGRLREIGVRAALGASRGRVAMQLIGENAVLALVGGALGALVATGAIRAFLLLAPPGLPRLEEIRMDLPVLAGAAAMTAISMLVFGVLPAILASRVDLQRFLNAAARHSPRGSRVAAEGMVAAQVALAVLVLCAAGLIGRSLLKLQRAELAFEPEPLIVAELTMRADRFDNRAKQLALLERLIQEARTIPGVTGVTPVVARPFSGEGGWDGRPRPVGQSNEDASRNPMINMDVVTPDYFATFGIPLLRGRAFTAADRAGAPPVVILSESAAREYWPGADPVGHRLSAAGNDTATVVGVVPDTRYRDLRVPRASIYFPLSQSVFPFAPTTLVMRSTGRPAELVPVVRRSLAAMDPAVAVVNVATFDAFLEGPLAQPRLNAVLLGVFASAALALAAVGLFGVMATMVRQRTRELGVRMALGATAGNLYRLVISRGLAIAIGGMAAGLGSALLLNRFLTGLLYGVSPTDLTTLAVVTGLVVTVALFATFIPARSSTRVDPLEALRD